MNQKRITIASNPFDEEQNLGGSFKSMEVLELLLLNNEDIDFDLIYVCFFYL